MNTKNTLCIISFVFLSKFLFGQDTLIVSPSSQKNYLKKKNELKLNLGMTFYSRPEISYERALSNDFSVGFIMYRLFFDKKGSRTNYNNVRQFYWGDGPYETSFYSLFTRYYFIDSEYKKIFLEGHLGTISNFVCSKYEKRYFQDQTGQQFLSDVCVEKKDSFKGCFGFAVGWKFVNKKNILIEVLGGVGKRFGASDVEYVRAGINVGKRF